MLARVWLVGTCDSQADSHIVRAAYYAVMKLIM